jgi:hypothetical protein
MFKSIGHTGSLWISLAHKTPSYDKNMLPKVVFEKRGLSNLKRVP